MSNFGAYWLGALVGLIFAVALAATLSIVSPLPGERPVEVAAAPEPRVEAAPSAPAPSPSDDPAPAAASEPSATAGADSAPATPAPAAPEPVSPEVAEQAPTPAPAPAPTPAPAPQPEAEAPAARSEPEAEPETAEAPAAPAPASTSNALRDNAERYRGDESQPLLAIVLVGLGDDSLNVDEIFLLPSPLTIAVDASSADPAGLVADARDSGFEAVLTIEADELSGLDSLLANAGPIVGVAMLENPISSPDGIADLTSGLGLRGMGLFDASADGGGPAYRAAQAIDLPAAPGGRRFDENPTSAAVYQALERAAFDARRTGAYVVFARPDGQVMTGLRRWMSVKANKSVAVAPLSTVMRKLSR